MNGTINCVASPSSTGPSTVIPAALSIATPLPFTSGLGSRQPITTRFTFASISRGVQGGVFLFVWQQGSSVTYAVAPSGDSAQLARAVGSAWGPPNLA